MSAVCSSCLNLVVAGGYIVMPLIGLGGFPCRSKRAHRGLHMTVDVGRAHVIVGSVYLSTLSNGGEEPRLLGLVCFGSADISGPVLWAVVAT